MTIAKPIWSLGDEVRDLVSGYTGIIVQRTECLNGCWRYTVQSRVDPKDGKMPDAYSLDEMQLEIVAERKVPAPANKSHGGPPTRVARV